MFFCCCHLSMARKVNAQPHQASVDHWPTIVSREVTCMPPQLTMYSCIDCSNWGTYLGQFWGFFCVIGCTPVSHLHSRSLAAFCRVFIQRPRLVIQRHCQANMSPFGVTPEKISDKLVLEESLSSTRHRHCSHLYVFCLSILPTSVSAVECSFSTPHPQIVRVIFT